MIMSTTKITQVCNINVSVSLYHLQGRDLKIKEEWTLLKDTNRIRPGLFSRSPGRGGGGGLSGPDAKNQS